MSHTRPAPRDVVLPGSTFGVLRRAIPPEACRDVFARALNEAGREAGAGFVAALNAEGPNGSHGGSYWDRMARLFARRGLGSIRHRRIHAGLGLVECRGGPEQEGGVQGNDPLRCPLTTGLLSGMLSAAAGRHLDLHPLPDDRAEPGVLRWVFGSDTAVQQVLEDLGGGSSLEDSIARL